MNVGDIIGQVRRRLDDITGKESKKGWKDPEIIDDYTNDVLNIMCRRCPGLIYDSSTAADPDGIPLCRLSIYANTKDASSGPAAFSIDATTGTISRASGSFVTDGIIAGNEITLSEFTNDGNNAAFIVSTVSALAIVVVSSTGMVTETGDGDEEIEVTEYTSTYSVSPYIVEIRRVKPKLLTDPLTKKTIEGLDMGARGWEDSDPSSPLYWLGDVDSNKMILHPPTDTSDTIKMKVFRLPLARLTADTLTGIPEIPVIYHPSMIPGILKYAFSKNDEETFRPNLAAKFGVEFDSELSRIGSELLAKHRVSTTNSTRKAFT